QHLTELCVVSCIELERDDVPAGGTGGSPGDGAAPPTGPRGWPRPGGAAGAPPEPNRCRRRAPARPRRTPAAGGAGARGPRGRRASGNLIDRVTYGRVTDFIVWHVKGHEWPAFNIADAALCIGVGLMVLDMFRARPAAATSSS